MKFLSRISISRIKFLICEYIQIIRKQVKNKNKIHLRFFKIKPQLCLFHFTRSS